jgi:hypothetical protein
MSMTTKTVVKVYGRRHGCKRVGEKRESVGTVGCLYGD